MSSKRLLSLLLVVVLIASLLPCNVAFAEESQTTVITVEDSSAVPGKTVAVNITIKNNPGILAMTLKLTYDETIATLVSVENGEAMSDMSFAPPVGDALKSGCQLSWDAETVDPDSVRDGVIATLTFRIAEDAEFNQAMTVGITSVGSIIDDEINPIVAEMVAGTLKVEYIPGDVNCDGMVSSTDTAYLRRYIAGGYGIAIYEPAGDVNADGLLTAVDVAYIRRYIAGGYGIVLKPAQQCTHGTLQATEAKAATCTAEGNIAYWACTECGKYFGDAEAKSEIALEETVLAAGHSFTDEWVSDENYHWHAAICEHTDEVKDKAEHTLENNVCTVCKHDTTKYLDAPANVRVSNDTIAWTAVPNATSYTVVANDIYKITGLETTSCPIDYLTYKVGDSYMKISTHGIISVKVMAEATGEYKASDWSEVCSDYYYIPNSTDQAKIDLLQNYGLGRAYNFVEDYYLDIEQVSSYNVLNPAKLLTIGSYVSAQNTKGYSDYYSYSSVDEYISKKEGSFGVSIGVDIPIAGSLNAQFNSECTSNYRNYAYNEMFVAEVGVTLKDHRILGLSIGENGSDNDALVACMDAAFLKDITGQTTNNLSKEELAAVLYNKYGTHVILGVTTGGSYMAQYSISTNDESVATAAQSSFKAEGNVNIKEIVKLDIGIEGKSLEETSWSSSNTEAHFKVTWIGSNQGATVNPGNLDSAIASFTSGITDDTAYTVRLANSDSNQTPSAIAISDLIAAVDPELAAAFDAYVASCADDSYEVLYGQYNTSLTRLVKAPAVVDGKNVLTIDLSSYQASGSMESAYDPNFVGGILKLYPVMYAQKIDKIVIRGAFDDAAKQNLIDSFTLALPKEWSGRTLEIVVENLGAVATSEQGLVDLTVVSNTTGITVTYQGINVIQQTGGQYLCYANDKLLALELKEDEAISFGTASVQSEIMLPTAKKANYEFAGWVDGEGTVVTSSAGKLYDVQLSAEIPVLYASWKPLTHKITMDENGATASGTTQMWQMYATGFALAYPETVEDVKTNGVTAIQIPAKTGYVFGGYFSQEPENNATVNVTDKGTQYIDADGKIIVSNMTFTEAVTIYAKWTPAQYTVVYDANGGTGEVGSTAHIYDVEQALAENKFTKSGMSFVGWNTEKDGSGTTYANQATVANLTTRSGATVTLYAVWTDNISVILDAAGATNERTTVVYMTPDMDAIYSDADCTKAITSIQTPGLTGYTFGGYYDSVENNKTPNPTGTNQRIDVSGSFVGEPKDLKDDLELVALWDLDQFTITWNTNENGNIVVTRTASPLAQATTGTLYKDSTIYYGDELTVTYSAKDGYQIAAQGLTNITVTGNVTSSEVYVNTKAKTYTITYDLSLATTCDEEGCYEDLSFTKQTYTVTYNSSYTLDVPTAEYYRFTGWYTADGDAVTYGDGKSLSQWTGLENITVYAHWVKEWNGVSYNGYTYVKTTEDFRNNISASSGPRKILLIDDITFTGYTGSVIWAEDRILDGGGNTISGVSRDLSSASELHTGLFSYNLGTVKNLTISNWQLCADDDDHDISGTHYAGLLCAENRGTIDNVNVFNSKLYIDVGSLNNGVDSYVSAGLICGINKGTITNCTVANGNYMNVYVGANYSSTAAEAYVGCIAGKSESGTISQCASQNNTMVVTVKADWEEGIFGRCKGHGKPRLYVGGVLGHTTGTTYSGLTASGNNLDSVLIERGCSCDTNTEFKKGDTVGYSG